MLLQRALREVTEEIDRLMRIRKIVASLHTTGSAADYPRYLSIPAELTESPDESALGPSPANLEFGVAADPGTLEIQPGSEPQVRRSRRKLRTERVTRTRRSLPPAPRALGGNIPVRPVFIAPRVEAAKAHSVEDGSTSDATPPPERPVSSSQEVGGLDALVRELARRPMLGL